MEPERCPACGESTVVRGSLRMPEQGNFPAYSVSFVFLDASVLVVNRGVPTDSVYHACVSCGHVWSSLDPQALRKFIASQGSELAKQLLDEFDFGPNRGLPDTEVAREVAAKVAEIDALVRSGKMGAAARYREWRNVTWDQALKDTKNWRDLKRDEKLALFGWVSKKKAVVDDFDSPEF